MSNSAIVRKIISGGPSTGHSGRARGLGNYAPPPASRGCGATKAAHRSSGDPHAEYPDIDLRVNAEGYVHKDGTPYS
jgi:hypothetical protein